MGRDRVQWRSTNASKISVAFKYMNEKYRVRKYGAITVESAARNWLTTPGHGLG